ncbi:hypothetical protein Tco_1457871 [Tanacetum coccineum]
MLLMEEYCPDDEVQKLESELWIHKMVGSDIDGYTARFHELARLVPHMVTPESQRVNRYIRGLALEIKAHVTSSKPATIQGAVSMVNRLTTDGIKDRLSRRRKMLEIKRGQMIRTGTEEGMIRTRDKELAPAFYMLLLCASSYQATPTWRNTSRFVKRIFRVLRRTLYVSLVYRRILGFETNRILYAGLGGMKDTFKSTSDGAQFLGEKLVGWSSKKQDCTALSNSGSRIACPIRLLGAPKSFWMRNSYRIMLSLQQDSIYCDSKSAIAISTNPGPTLKNKHTFVSLPFH